MPTVTTSISDRIAAIDVILAAGTSSVTIGDRRVDHDLDELRKERAHLQQRLSASSSGSQFRRVVFKGGSAL